MLKIRKGETLDLPQVYSLIKELAIFEKAENEVVTNVESMLSDWKYYEFLIAESDGLIIGTAIYFYTYSTWKGKTLYLEDLIVKENQRGKGTGTLLFNELIKIAKSENVKRMSWQVLDWNEIAINFYKKLNANFDTGWINCKLTFEQLQSFTTK